MGNKESSSKSTVQPQQGIKSQQKDNQPRVNNAQKSTPTDKGLFEQNPTQLAKDKKGRLHPRWSYVLTQCQQLHSQQTDQYVKQISQQTKKIGTQCLKQYPDEDSKFIECLQIVSQPIKHISYQAQQQIIKLGNTANKCLLENKKQAQCIEEVRKHLHGCLINAINEMKKIKVQL